MVYPDTAFRVKIQATKVTTWCILTMSLGWRYRPSRRHHGVSWFLTLPLRWRYRPSRIQHVYPGTAFKVKIQAIKDSGCVPFIFLRYDTIPIKWLRYDMIPNSLKNSAKQFIPSNLKSIPLTKSQYITLQTNHLVYILFLDY